MENKNSINSTSSEIVKNRIDGLSTSIAVRLGQIKTTIKNASETEKEKIAEMLKSVSIWVEELTEMCYAKSVKTGFVLNTPEDSEPESPQPE